MSNSSSKSTLSSSGPSIAIHLTGMDILNLGLFTLPNHDTANILAKGFSGKVTFCVKGSADNVRNFFNSLKVGVIDKWIW